MPYFNDTDRTPERAGKMMAAAVYLFVVALLVYTLMR